MILHLPPDAPLAARLAADAALFGHIGGGMAGIAAGFVAVAAKKGGRVHRIAGDGFVAAMLVGYGIGCLVSPLIRQPGNMGGAAIAIYLILTGWMTVRRPIAPQGVGETGAFAGVRVAVFGLLGLAAVAALDPMLLGGVPPLAFLTLAAACGLAAVSDWRVAQAGGLAGPARLRRHLWRMNLAFFIGTGSLFLGQPRVFPPALRFSPPLILLGVAPLLIMAFWLYRTRDRRRSARPVGPAPIQEALS